MHPAISVIFFTVISGAGFGFMALLGFGWAMPQGPLAAFLISLLAGGLCVIGLLSSLFHLGHPERFWRAFSQWRSSWLSREGVLSVVTLTLFAIYALVWMVTGDRLGWLGFIIAILSIITIYATSMIYASLKTVPSWYNYLTSACYVAFGLASGFALASTFGVKYEIGNISVTWLSIIVLLAAWGLKLMWWHRADNIGFSETGTDAGTATGLGHLGKVTLFEKPHSGENYLTKETCQKASGAFRDFWTFGSIYFGSLWLCNRRCWSIYVCWVYLNLGGLICRKMVVLCRSQTCGIVLLLS
jgi:DMSO reductase anchor subunit